jgi:hypothetical protein
MTRGMMLAGLMLRGKVLTHRKVAQGALSMPADVT